MRPAFSTRVKTISSRIPTVEDSDSVRRELSPPGALRLHAPEEHPVVLRGREGHRTVLERRDQLK
jgi:hypothetical protein